MHFRTQVGERKGIRRRRRPDDDVDPMTGRKDILSHDLAQAALQAVAIHRIPPVPRHDDPDPWKTERGSARPKREMTGPYDFPLLLHTPDFCATADALRPRVAQAPLTRRRTWTEAARSGASDPFCAGD